MTLPEFGPVLTDRIIRRGIKVHRKLGPGLTLTEYPDRHALQNPDGIAYVTDRAGRVAFTHDRVEPDLPIC
jgi:hypothetical protein